MKTMILDRRLRANPENLISILKQGVKPIGWRISANGNKQAAILTFSIFGRFLNESEYLFPALGWITITKLVEGESLVRICKIGLDDDKAPHIQAYLDAQDYDVLEMFQDLAAFLIRAVEGEQPTKAAKPESSASVSQIINNTIINVQNNSGNIVVGDNNDLNITQ